MFSHNHDEPKFLILNWNYIKTVVLGKLYFVLRNSNNIEYLNKSL